jgi:hypothetical protein
MGTFAGLAEDATFTADFGNEAYLFAISYDGNVISPSQVTFDGGNDVVLKVVSASSVREPGTLMLLGASLLGLRLAQRVAGHRSVLQRVMRLGRAADQVWA